MSRGAVLGVFVVRPKSGGHRKKVLILLFLVVTRLRCSFELFHQTFPLRSDLRSRLDRCIILKIHTADKATKV